MNFQTDGSYFKINDNVIYTIGKNSKMVKVIKIDPTGYLENNFILVEDDENNEIHRVEDIYPYITKRLPDFYKKYNLNFAVKSFTIEKFLKIISEFMLDNPNSINISIGSGNGYIERYLENNIKKEIICIEPHFDKIILNQFKKFLKNYQMILKIICNHQNLIEQKIIMVKLKILTYLLIGKVLLIMKMIT